MSRRPSPPPGQPPTHDGQSLFASQLAADIAALIPAVVKLSDALNLMTDTAYGSDNAHSDTFGQYANFPLLPDAMRANASDLPQQMRDAVTALRAWAKGEMLRHAAQTLIDSADKLQPR